MKAYQIDALTLRKLMFPANPQPTLSLSLSLSNPYSFETNGVTLSFLLIHTYMHTYILMLAGEDQNKL